MPTINRKHEIAEQKNRLTNLNTEFAESPISAGRIQTRTNDMLEYAKRTIHEITKPDFVQVRWRELSFLKRRNFEAATSILMECMDLLGTRSAIANASIICVFVGFELSSIDNKPNTWLLLASLEQMFCVVLGRVNQPVLTTIRTMGKVTSSNSVHKYIPIQNSLLSWL